MSTPDMAELGPRIATVTGAPLEDLLEVPVSPTERFEFGHVPPGKYLLSLYPPTPGIASMPYHRGADRRLSGLSWSAAHEKCLGPHHRPGTARFLTAFWGFIPRRPMSAERSMRTEPLAWICIPHVTRSTLRGFPSAILLHPSKIGNEDVTQQGIVVSNQRRFGCRDHRERANDASPRFER